MSDLDYDLLPESAQHLADVIGLPSAIVVIKRRGGTRLRGPVDAELRSALGDDAADALDAYLAGSSFDVPRAQNAAAAAERRAIVAAYHAGAKAPELALAYHCTERWVYKLVARRQDEIRARQRTLF